MPCSICLCSKRFYQEIRQLKCGHRFHLKCIEEWTNHSLTCPVCRITILKQKNVSFSDTILVNKSSHPKYKNMSELLYHCGIE